MEEIQNMTEVSKSAKQAEHGTEDEQEEDVMMPRRLHRVQEHDEQGSLAEVEKISDRDQEHDGKDDREEEAMMPRRLHRKDESHNSQDHDERSVHESESVGKLLPLDHKKDESVNQSDNEDPHQGVDPVESPIEVDGTKRLPPPAPKLVQLSQKEKSHMTTVDENAIECDSVCEEIQEEWKQTPKNSAAEEDKEKKYDVATGDDEKELPSPSKSDVSKVSDVRVQDVEQVIGLIKEAPSPSISHVSKASHSRGQEVEEVIGLIMDVEDDFCYVKHTNLHNIKIKHDETEAQEDEEQPHGQQNNHKEWHIILEKLCFTTPTFLHELVVCLKTQFLAQLIAFCKGMSAVGEAIVPIVGGSTRGYAIVGILLGFLAYYSTLFGLWICEWLGYSYGVRWALLGGVIGAVCGAKAAPKEKPSGFRRAFNRFKPFFVALTKAACSFFPVAQFGGALYELVLIGKDGVKEGYHHIKS